MKTYVLTLSKVFPKSHKRAGEPTNFAEKFRKTKLHTIRANYHFWYERFKNIANGTACLSVRQWTGKPYCSKQVELARLTAADGISLQRLEFDQDRDGCVRWDFFTLGGCFPDVADLAANDGLSLADWKGWFKNYDLTQPLAVIQFTPFTYHSKF